MQILKSVLAFIDNFNEWVGKIISLIIVPIVLIILLDVILRYAFDAPTIWVNETSWYLFGGMFIFGGAYASKTKGHVNVDVVLTHVSRRTRAIMAVIVTWFAFLFLFIIIWQGLGMSLISLATMEHSGTPWNPPVWEMKFTVPIGAFLMLMQTLAWYVRDFYTAVTGKELV